jgi:hypothetical protein
MKRAIICDLDNTLFDVDHILDPHTHSGFKHEDWEGRCNTLKYDRVVPAVAEMLELFGYHQKNPARIVLLTSRPESIRSQTVAQLKLHGIDWDNLFMADGADPHYANSDWKVSIAKTVDKYYPVMVVLEDVDSNVSAFRRAGFNCWQVKADHFTNRPRGITP